MFELGDILEPVSDQTVKRVVTENIKYLMKREGLLSRDMTVVIPEGAYDYTLKGDELSDLGRFSGGFDVHAREGIIASGNVVGTIAPDLLDIEVQITGSR